MLVWRRMQNAGALNLQNGLWLLPHTPDHEKFINATLADIEKHGGMAWAFTAQLVDPAKQERLIARFQKERQEEYVEFASRCQEFLQEIARETQVRKWTFAELEENEHDLHKLTQWLHQIQRRDFFPDTSGQEAIAQLARCTASLQTFTQTVYAQQGVISSGEGSSTKEVSALATYREEAKEAGEDA